jgi:hypothetical protein
MGVSISNSTAVMLGNTMLICLYGTVFLLTQIMLQQGGTPLDSCLCCNGKTVVQCTYICEQTLPSKENTCGLDIIIKSCLHHVWEKEVVSRACSWR